MRVFVVSLLLLITTAVSAQPKIKAKILLNNEYSKIFDYFEARGERFEQIEVEETVLTYRDRKQDYTVSYEFSYVENKKVCTASILIIDYMRAEELIAYHEHKESWIYMHDNIWVYGKNIYEEPLLVTVLYGKDTVKFKYEFFF